MLKLRLKKAKDHNQKPCTPNILPCRIHHDAPVDASTRYWAPETAKGQSEFQLLLHADQTPIQSFIIDEKPEVYFRGRKLRGRELQVPQGYRGVIVKEAGNEMTGFQTLEQGGLENDEGEQREEEQEEITMLNEISAFDKLLIWSHESIVEGNDAFVKGLSEWIGFAEAVSLVFPGCGRLYMHNGC